jgi:hypothetical protein
VATNVRCDWGFGGGVYQSKLNVKDCQR